MSVRLVLATANPDKAAEIRAIGDGSGIELLARPTDVPDVEETGTTLLENANQKARALVEATGTAAVADDTGLEVAVLGGAPGVYSARYAGEGATYADNVSKLLEAMSGLSGAERRARFVTVAVAFFPDRTSIWTQGTVEGRITEAARGTAGFGYDPVFVPDEGDGRTFAEMSSAEKHDLSHRGRAFRALFQALSARRD